jgi:hypothetical protein
MAWSAKFARPVLLPTGGHLRTLGDAREFLGQLRAYEANSLEWQCAIAAVLLVGKNGCCTDMARAALVEAISRNGELHQFPRKLPQEQRVGDEQL